MSNQPTAPAAKNRGYHAITLQVFLAFFLTYLSLSPGAISGMGYQAEEMKAGDDVINWLGSKAGLAPAPQAIQPCRNGYLGLVLDVPTLSAARLFPPRQELLREMSMASQSVLLSALLVTLIFAWARRISNSVRLAAAMALAAGFCTSLWPYAYIGLENKQSLALLCAGFLALASDRPGGWMQSLGLAVTAGFAVGVKSNGVFLSPAVLFLLWRYLKRLGDAGMTRRDITLRGALVFALTATLYWAGLFSRACFWKDYGGSIGFAKTWIPNDWLAPLFHFEALLASPNKGFVVYIPVALAALYALPALLGRRSPEAWFFALSLAGIAGGSSLLRFFSDETWGPRYLHAVIGPMILCLTVAIQERGRAFRAGVALLALAGGAIALFGAMFTYGSLHRSAMRSGQSTLEALQGDLVWNHILFNARLFKFWMLKQHPPVWVPEHKWFYEAPPDAKPWPPLDLVEYVMPQSVLLRNWPLDLDGAALQIWSGYLISGIAGLLLFSFLAVRLLRRPRAPAP